MTAAGFPANRRLVKASIWNIGVRISSSVILKFTTALNQQEAAKAMPSCLRPQNGKVFRSINGGVVVRRTGQVDQLACQSLNPS
jgi:hypothetical protein